MIFVLKLRVFVAIAASINIVHGLTRESMTIQNETNSPTLFTLDLYKASEFPAFDCDKTSEISEFSKRDQEQNTVVSLIYALVSKLKELKLGWLINEELFSEILQKGTDRELHTPIGVTHRVLGVNHRHKLNLGYCAKPRSIDTQASRRNAGENFGGFQNTDDGFTLVSVISGNGDFLPPGKDSTALCEKVDEVVNGLYRRIIDKFAFKPKELVKFSWDGLSGLGAPAGCLSMFHAIISPRNQIRITNLGLSWAGLYRDGDLVQATEPQMHEDGTEYQICNEITGFSPGHTDLVQDSEEYTWQAQEGDTFVVVSKGVREALSVVDIANAFTLIKSLGPEANAFRQENDPDLFSMGIVKAAQIASGGQPKIDMIAAVVGIGPAV